MSCDHPGETTLYSTAVTHTFPQSCPTFLALIFFFPPLSHLPSTFKAQICAFKIVFLSVDFVAWALALASANRRSRFCSLLLPRFSASIILSVLFFLARLMPALIFWYFFSFRCLRRTTPSRNCLTRRVDSLTATSTASRRRGTPSPLSQKVQVHFRR